MTTVSDTASTSAITPAPGERIGLRRPGRGERGGVLNVFSHAILVCWGLMVALPLLWAVMSAFKTDAEIVRDPIGLPDGLHWENFTTAWTTGHIGDLFLNTVIVMAGGVAGTMLLGAMAAYVLARYDFPGNRAIYYLFIAGLTLPIFLAIVPLYKVVANIGASFPWLGLNSYLMLVIVYIAFSLPFTVFFLHSFFRTLPTEIAEAAIMDGATHTKLFFKVMLPMAKPGLISIGIFNVIGQWNQWLLPTVLMQPQSGGEEKHAMLAQGLIELMVNQGYQGDYGALFAGTTMAMLPILIVYVSFQRQVQAGLTGATLK
ncbi:carbohydrate ABC transporter permease [Rhizomonospora bruguierae]|uniref:carbohydrate ABC transporter permease n=1 Tax=Rhizomonospora bruguierae TaxID=1581705 RepID=UPI001BCD8A10